MTLKEQKVGFKANKAPLDTSLMIKMIKNNKNKNKTFMKNCSLI